MTTRVSMTDEEHRARHVELHRALDELFADYIEHHRQQVGFLDTPVGELIKWSFQQTQKPESL